MKRDAEILYRLTHGFGPDGPETRKERPGEDS